MKISNVICTKSSNTNMFVTGKQYSLERISGDLYVYPHKAEYPYGVTENLEHESLEECFCFAIVSI